MNGEKWDGSVAMACGVLVVRARCQGNSAAVSIPKGYLELARAAWRVGERNGYV